MGRSRIALVLLVVGACSHSQVLSYPSQLRLHARELQTTGRAPVLVVGEPAFVVDADTDVSVAVPDGPGELVRHLTIGELVAGCVPGAVQQPPECLASKVIEREIVVGTREHRHIGRTVTTIATGGFVLGVGGVCIAECTREQVGTGVGIAALGALLVLVGFGLH
jgi:hypothetical protein